MKHTTLFIAILSCLILNACVDSVVVRQGNTFNLETVIQTEKSVVLSDLSDSLECIPLETNDSSLLTGNAYLLYGDKQNLFVCSKDLVYRFRTDGRFLNTIGRKGNGPEEYSRLYSVSVDRNNNRLLYHLGQDKIQFWDYDGTFQKEITLQDGEETTSVRMLGQHILSENRVYSEDGLQIAIHIFDLEGNLLKEILMDQDDKLVNTTLYTAPLMYVSKDAVKYKNLYDGKLYSFSGDSLNLQCIFDLGHYTPSRELQEDVDKKKTLLSEFAQLVYIGESDSRFYLLIIYDNNLRGIILDKENGKVICNQTMDMPQKGGGIENDYIDSGYFWPSFIDESNDMYCLLPIEKITAAGKEKMKHYLPADFSLTDDANPFVLKVH